MDTIQTKHMYHFIPEGDLMVLDQRIVKHLKYITKLNGEPTYVRDDQDKIQSVYFPMNKIMEFADIKERGYYTSHTKLKVVPVGIPLFFLPTSKLLNRAPACSGMYYTLRHIMFR